jgi:hypothetical protein
VSLKEIKIGNTTFAGIPTLVNLPDQLKCWHVDGIVGSNLLRNSIVVFDGQKHQIIITDQLDKLPFLNKKNSGILQPIPTYKARPL